MKGIWGDRGAAAVEFAVLIPLLMVIVFGIIEFGFIWLQSHYIANAAREGARVAATGQDQSQIQKAVKEYLKGVYADARVDGTGDYASPPSNGGCCTGYDFIEVEITPKDDEGYMLFIDVPDSDVEDPHAVKVTVTVQTAQVWDPILWDLLGLIPGSTVPEDLDEISSFAVFAVGP